MDLVKDPDSSTKEISDTKKNVTEPIKINEKPAEADSDSDSEIIENLKPRNRRGTADSEEKDLNVSLLSSNIDFVELQDTSDIMESLNNVDLSKESLTPEKSLSSQSHYSDAEDYAQNQKENTNDKVSANTENFPVKQLENEEMRIDETHSKLDIDVPIDKNVKHPAYIPKDSRYYLHDSRDIEEEKDQDNTQHRRRERPGIDADKWDHDKFFQERNQGVKSRPRKFNTVSRFNQDQFDSYHNPGSTVNDDFKNQKPNQQGTQRNFNDSRKVQNSSSSKNVVNDKTQSFSTRHSYRSYNPSAENNEVPRYSNRVSASQYKNDGHNPQKTSNSNINETRANPVRRVQSSRTANGFDHYQRSPADRGGSRRNYVGDNNDSDFKNGTSNALKSDDKRRVVNTQRRGASGPHPSYRTSRNRV